MIHLEQSRDHRNVFWEKPDELHAVAVEKFKIDFTAILQIAINVTIARGTGITIGKVKRFKIEAFVRAEVITVFGITRKTAGAGITYLTARTRFTFEVVTLWIFIVRRSFGTAILQTPAPVDLAAILIILVYVGIRQTASN